MSHSSVAQKMTKLATCQKLRHALGGNMPSFPPNSQPLSVPPSFLSSHLDAHHDSLPGLHIIIPNLLTILCRQLDAAHNQKELNCPLLGAVQSAGQPLTGKCTLSRWEKLLRWKKAAGSLPPMDFSIGSCTEVGLYGLRSTQAAFLLQPSETSLSVCTSSQVCRDGYLQLF